MFVNSHFSDLLRIFNDNRIQYLVIGGYAVVHYAGPRYTKDLDVWISTDFSTSAAVFAALREFGQPLAGMTIDDYFHFAEGSFFLEMGAPPERIDVLMGFLGLTFEEAWPRRTEVDFDGLLVSFISKADLITLKRAADRPEDLLDANRLSLEG